MWKDNYSQKTDRGGFCYKAVILDKLLLCAVSRGQRGNREYVWKAGRFMCLHVLVCFEAVVVLNELNTVISLTLEGNPREAVCFLTCVCEVAVLKFIFFRERNILMYVCG